MVTLLGLMLREPASADESIKDARQRRENARNAQLQAARQINLLSAETTEVAKAVRDLEEAVVAQQAKVEDSRRRLADAHAELVATEAALGVADQILEMATAEASRVLIERYVGESADAPLLIFRSEDAHEALRKEAALDFLHTSGQDALSNLAAAAADRAQAVATANRAYAETERLREQIAAELGELEARRASQIAARAELERRVSEWRRKEDQLERDELELTQLIQQRQLEVLKVSDASAAAASLRGFITPAAGALGSGFGLRPHPIFREVRPHTGVDIDAKSGTAVWAAKEGRVLFSGTLTGYGNVIIIDHGAGVSSLYAHLSKSLVNQGDTVRKGEVIGLVGSTGWSTGPHLHFEVRVGGVAKDPLLFLP